MIPLSDPDLRRRTFPYVTISLLALNVLVFIYQLSLDELQAFRFVYRLGVIPAELLGGVELTQVPVTVGAGVELVDLTSPVPTWATMFTSMFMHGGFLHLIGNMLFLWVFGDNVEDRFGHLRYLLFYLAAGVAAVFAQTYVGQDSLVPMVGASGAISGVLGAYLVLYPYSRINTLIFLGIITTVQVPAILLLGFWVILQFFSGVGSLGPEVSGGGVAYFAHLGGFILGVAAALIFFRITGGRIRPLKPSAIGRRSQVRWPRINLPRRKSRLTKWASVACPECGTSMLEFIDTLHRWRCIRCKRTFS